MPLSKIGKEFMALLQDTTVFHSPALKLAILSKEKTYPAFCTSPSASVQDSSGTFVQVNSGIWGPE